MGGAFKPGRLIELLNEAESQLGDPHAEAIEEARERLVNPEAWINFPLIERETPAPAAAGNSKKAPETFYDRIKEIEQDLVKIARELNADESYETAARAQAALIAVSDIAHGDVDFDSWEWNK